MPSGLELELCLLVPALAAVQSVFGVGLLVFGTSVLLLFGLPFSEVLAYLLPCSIVISALQVTDAGFGFEPIRRKCLLFTAPGVLSGTFLALVVLRHQLDMRQIVGTMLAVTGGLRMLGRLRQRMQSFVCDRLSPLLLLLGLIQGATNLGGGILIVIVSSLYEDKHNVRKHIAFCYGMMALIQLAVLFLTAAVHVNLPLWLTLPALAACSYALVGTRIFRMTRESIYQWVLTALIGRFGVLLFLPA